MRLASRSGRRSSGESTGCDAAEGDVVPAAGAGVQPVEVELLGRETSLPRLFVQRDGEVAQVRPRRRRLHVDLDHAGVGRDDQLGKARVRRRSVPLEDEPASGEPPRPSRSPSAGPRRPRVRSVGGRNTCTCPSRASNVSAVVRAPFGVDDGDLRDAGRAAASPPAGTTARPCSGSFHATDSSGSRSPTALVPGRAPAARGGRSMRGSSTRRSVVSGSTQPVVG